jgi:molecular chaperone DnaK
VTPVPTSPPSRPITLKIKFKCQSLEQFIERYHIDISRSGIFIRTTDPLAVPTLLRFEFQLQDGSPMLSGSGLVVWNRGRDSPGVPGMGVRFNTLTPESQPRLEQILAGQKRLAPSDFVSRFEQGSLDSLHPPRPEPGADAMVFGDEPCRVTSLPDLDKAVKAIVASLSEAKPGAKKPT